MKILLPIIAAWLLLIQAAHAVVVLQYHHISDTTPAATSISPELFIRHLKQIDELGYSVVSLPEIVDLLKSKKALPNKSVVITFDDGYDSVYNTAFPELKKREWPFTVFVNTQPVEESRAGFVTWAQLREMKSAGATIANHTHSHTHLLRRLEKESDREWRQRIRTDILQAQQLIETRVDQQHRLFAYPYGEYDIDVLALMDELNFVAFGQQSGPLPQSIQNTELLLTLPRFPFGGNYGADDFAVKLQTLPMPIRAVQVLNDSDKPLSNTVLPQGETKPRLVLELGDSVNSVVQCFASGQGAIRIDQKNKKVEAQANKALPVGRSRYNCTAASNERGRFYWYSQFFIRKRNDGSWYPEP